MVSLVIIFLVASVDAIDAEMIGCTMCSLITIGCRLGRHGGHPSIPPNVLVNRRVG